MATLFSLTNAVKAVDVQTDFVGIPSTGILAGVGNGNSPSFSVNFNLNLTNEAVISSAILSYVQDSPALATDNIILINTYNNETIDIVSSIFAGSKGSDKLTTTVQNWLSEPSKNFGIIIKTGSSNNNDRIFLTDIKLTVLYHLPDKVAPKILLTGITKVTEFQYKLNLTADEPVTVTVNYGKNSNYGFMAAPTPIVTLPYPSILPPEVPSELKDIYLMQLQLGLTYHYQFVLKDVAGNITKSQDFMFLTGSDALNKTQSLQNDSALAIPKNLTLELVHNNGVAGVQLDWSAPESANIEGYLLYRATGARDFQEMAQVDRDTFTFTDEQVDPAMEYTYTVRSFQGTSISNQAESKKISIPLLLGVTPMPMQNDSRTQIFLALLAGATVVFLVGYWIYRFFDRIFAIFRSPHPRKQIKNVLKDPDYVD